VKTHGLPGGSSVKWSGDELLKAAREEFLNKLRLAVEYVRGRAASNVSVSSRGSGPSQPGDFPHADTGRLRNSIFSNVDEKALEGTVGTNLKYGLWLEFGTRGPRVIEARGGGVLSWVGRDGVRRFAKRVTIPPLAARSYLRRSLKEAEPKLKSLFAEQYKNLTVG
jgi:hypothetical protein